MSGNFIYKKYTLRTGEKTDAVNKVTRPIKFLQLTNFINFVIGRLEIVRALYFYMCN